MRPGAVTAALAAAIVGTGVARRWRESRRPGDRPPPATDRRGPAARWLSTWVPTAPRTHEGAVLAAAWAGPLTAVGGILATLGGARAEWDAHRGCWVATGVGGPSGLLLGALGLDANTVGHVVIVRTPSASTTLLDHEAVHVRQGERLGPLLPIAYAVLGARHGYRDNPLERAARYGARRPEG